MKMNGHDFKLAKHLTWRYSNPDTDVDLSGNPVARGYISIVSKLDCTRYEKNGKTYLNTDNTKAIPIDHGGTCYGFGRSRKYLGHYTRPVYMVRNNRVWVATMHYEHEPKDHRRE